MRKFGMIALSTICASHLMGESESVKLSEVTVTSASGFEQNIADAPASISVITAEELQKKSYTDVVDAVKNIPGVFVSGGGDKQDITIRGMGAGYTLYLVNGRPVSPGRNANTNGSDGGKMGASLPPIDMIERIEIIRGPMSSLYGSDAMGGVINIITKKASSKEWTGSITAEYTKAKNNVSADKYNTSLYMSGPLVEDKLALSFNAGFQGADESKYLSGGNVGDGGASQSDKKVRKFGTELSWYINDENELTFSYDFTRQEYKHNAGVSAAADGSNENEKNLYALTHRGTYGDLLTTTYLQYDQTAKVYETGNDKKQEKYLTFNTQGTYFMGDHTISFGGQYKKERVDDTTNGMFTARPDIAVDHVERWIMALFVEDEWRLSDRFALTAGLRYNHDQYFSGHVTPRIYGIYHITDSFTFKAGVSTGYKQPTASAISEGFGQRTGKGSGIIVGNPNLKPEKSVSYEAGFNYSDYDLGLFSSLMVYHTDFKDKISEVRDCETPNTTNNSPSSTWGCSFKGTPYRFVSMRENVDKAVIQGVELTLDYDITKDFKVSSSYTYTRSEQKSGDFKGEPLNKMPKHALNVGADYEFNPKWSIWGQYNYRGKTSDYLSRTSMSKGTPAYGFVDLGLVYNATKKLQLRGGVYNIANKEVTDGDYGEVLEGRRFVASVTARF